MGVLFVRFKGLFLNALEEWICSDTLAELYKFRKFQGKNLRAAVAFPKMLAGIFCTQNDIFISEIKRHYFLHVTKI